MNNLVGRFSGLQGMSTSSAALLVMKAVVGAILSEPDVNGARDVMLWNRQVVMFTLATIKDPEVHNSAPFYRLRPASES